jgi:Fe-S-cluster containining protein
MVEPVRDCLSCGACCREGYDTVEVDGDDPALVAHPDLATMGPFGRLNLRRDGPRCACLRLDGKRYTCAIYQDRPRTCRELEVGSEACRTARARVGLPP